MKAKIVQILENNLFFCEYQPIVCTKTQKIHAYEALARFKIGSEWIPPNLVFNSIHQEPTLFFILESRLKKFQLENRPKKAGLFLNLDPHVCDEHYQLNHWLSTFSSQPTNLVIEIIKNTNISNIDNIRNFMKELNYAGIKVALDDIGGVKNLVSFELLDGADYLKFDLHWFALLSRSHSYKKLLQGLIFFAKDKNIKCIFEGVETPEKFDLACELGADYAQGFLFKDRFIQAESGAETRSVRGVSSSAETAIVPSEQFGGRNWADGTS